MNIDCLEIMEKWKFNQYFPKLDMSAYRKSYEDGNRILSGPSGCEGFAVMDRESLIGLFEYYPDIDGKPEIGLALSPDLIYQGLGKKVMDAGIIHLLKYNQYDESYIYLTVSAENIPGIKFYMKYGFSKYKEVKNGEEEITDYKMKYKL
ncbi:MAG: GNAT family N-acetyltransferase [Bacteroidetes bacterium]|nr:GNAT family N-acetyltransferase [Bacteroidota bacterium]